MSDRQTKKVNLHFRLNDGTGGVSLDDLVSLLSDLISEVELLKNKVEASRISITDPISANVETLSKPEKSEP